MAALTGNTIAGTYLTLLKLTSAALGADASAKYIEDAAGTDSALSLSTTRVGIGTASPDADLHIEGGGGSDAVKLEMKSTATSGGQQRTYLKMLEGNNDGWQIWMQGDASNDPLYFAPVAGDSVGTTAMTILDNGNVGIGTAAPSTPFHVDTTNVGSEGASVNAIARFTRTDAGTASHGRTLLIGATDNEALWIQSHQTDDFTVDTILALNPGGGNVGIGITNPSNALHVLADHSGSYAAQFHNENAAGWGMLVRGGADSGDYSLTIQDKDETALMVVKSNGNVGIGEPSPSYRLDVRNATGATRIRINSAALGAGEYSHIYPTGTASGQTRTGYTGAVYWDQSGSGGTDAPVGMMNLQQGDGSSQFYWTQNSGGIGLLMTSVTASQVGSSSGTVVGDQSSDERLKDISGDPFPYGLSEINSLTPIKYKIKSDTTPNKPFKLGFGAQTIQPILPEVVYNTGGCVDGVHPTTYDEEGNEVFGEPKSDDCSQLAMQYVQIIPVLVKAVQELSAKVTALENA